MASKQETSASCEVDEEEYEEYEEEEFEEVEEGEDYEEAFEEEEEIEQSEADEENEKKVVEVQDYEEEFEVEEEEEEGIEQNEKEDVDEKKVVKVQDYEEAFEEEEEIEQSEEDEENEKKVVEVQDYEEEFEVVVEEEEGIEQNEEEDVDEKKVVKVQDYEEAFEEEEIEQNEEDDKKKVVKIQKFHEEVEESVQDPVKEEKKSANPERPSESVGNALPPLAVFPPLLQSVSDLEKLHCALSKFLYQWNSLNRSLDSITSVIDARASSQHDARSNEQEKDERSKREEEKDERSKRDEEKDERSEQEKKDERSEQEKKDERSEQEKKDERSEVEILCERMNGKALRKYLESNLSDLDRLRHDVPEVFRRLPDPERLVFDAVGKFYTQGRNAYNNNNTYIVSFRRAIVYLLEFLVLSGRPNGDSSVKEMAHLAAHVWWKRLVNENIKLASELDSLGLILFLACFGIPKGFGSKDLGILLLECNLLKKKIDVFRRSNILVEKIPGVIKDLIRGEMYFEAAKLSCCFGLTDKFPPIPLLSSFVAKVIQSEKEERHQSQHSLRSVNEANIRELKSLRSVVECLEDHKLDINNLTCVNIRERISKLEYIENEMRPEKKILKRKAFHLVADMKSETQSKESFPSPSEASQNGPSQMIHDKPLFPDSKVENSALSVGVNNTKDYPYGWERKYYDFSTCYRSSAMEYPSAQQFYQPQGSVYGNGGGVSGRNLYQFADTVIQHEEQLRKCNRSSNTSPAGAKIGHH